jgi:hypothetical protein
MIHFRCSYCGKQYMVAESRIGELLTCSCKQMLKVPRRSGGSARYRTWSALFIEMLVYGGGGAVLFFLLGATLVYQAGTGLRRTWFVPIGMALIGFLIGALGGEAGINWIGRKIRDHEQS